MKKTIILCLVICALVTVVWFGITKLASDSIEVAHPTRGLAVLAVYATGTVEATVMMPIAPRISAKLVELNVDEGNKVEKGQILVNPHI